MKVDFHLTRVNHAIHFNKAEGVVIQQKSVKGKW